MGERRDRGANALPWLREARSGSGPAPGRSLGAYGSRVCHRNTTPPVSGSATIVMGMRRHPKRNFCGQEHRQHEGDRAGQRRAVGLSWTQLARGSTWHSGGSDHGTVPAPSRIRADPVARGASVVWRCACEGASGRASPTPRAGTRGPRAATPAAPASDRAGSGSTGRSSRAASGRFAVPTSKTFWSSTNAWP